MRGSGPSILKWLLGRIGILVIAAAFRYVALLFNAPFVLSVAAMIVAISAVLDDVYGVAVLELMRRLPFMGARIPAEFSLDWGDLLRLYARVTFALFVAGEIVRAVFRLKPPTLRRRLLTLLMVATLGWGFAIAHLPVVKVARDSTRIGLAGTFVLFYVLGVAGFALGGVVTWASQGLINRVLGFLERRTES